MSIYGYESAFGAWDQTSKAMRSAIEDWFSLYYGKAEADAEPAQRIAYTVVTKLVRTIFWGVQGGGKGQKCGLGAGRTGKGQKAGHAAGADWR